MGEAVRETRKGVVQRHVPDVERFFKGCHVRVAARVEDDVEEKVLLSKVAKSSGTVGNRALEIRLPTRQYEIFFEVVTMCSLFFGYYGSLPFCKMM